jgi:hypothetical protein
MKVVSLIKICLNGTWNSIHIGKHLSDKLPIQNDLEHHQNEGQNLDIKIGNRLFENMSQFKYWE